jgi:zinc transport system permease protein
MPMFKSRRPEDLKVLEPFLLRAVAAAVGLAVVAAPLGAVVVWNRMAYFGEAVAQASLLGIALALAFEINLFLGAIVATMAAAGLLILFSRQKVLPLDSALGLMHQGTLAAGFIALTMLRGPAVDIIGYLFGDIYAVAPTDLYWIFGGGALALMVVWRLWQPLLRLAVHEELAAAEGVPLERVRALFIVTLALFVAVAIKIVGVLLVIAFLIVPAVAARPFSKTPERMVLLAGAIGAACVIAGISASVAIDAPGGPSIVLVMSLAATASLVYAALGERG